MNPLTETIDSHNWTAAENVRPAHLDGVAVPMRLENPGPAISHAPVTFGVDLPSGVVHDDCRMTISCAHTCGLDVQQEVLARWPDGSVKWMLIDFIADVIPSGTSHWKLRRLENVDTKAQPGIERLAATVDSETPVRVVGQRVEFNHTCFEVEGSETTSISFELKNAAHQQRRLKIQSVEWETVGPVRSTLRIEGTSIRCGGLRFQARVNCYLRSGLVEVQVRLHNPNRAAHKGGLWDLGDSGSILFHAFDVRVSIGPASNTNPTTCSWQCELQSPMRTGDGKFISVYQESSGGENWHSPNHVNRHGNVPLRFRGYRATASDEQWSGLRATPTINLTRRNMLLEVTVPEFWQQFPKSIAADADGVRIGLFPLQYPDLHELQGGEQKTHTFWMRLSPGQDPSKLVNSLEWIHNRPRVVIAPEWHRETEAIPYFITEANEPLGELRPVARSAIHGSNSILTRREQIDEYGWRHYGETWADHEQSYYDGTGPVISHYNNQFDVIQSALVQMLRSGDPAWFDVWEPLARHVSDIDIYHTHDDRTAYNGGLFWHTDHYRSSHTCCHRTYSGRNAKEGPCYGGGPSSEHNYTTGLLYAYYLTGNRDFRDAVVSLADWVINMDDGQQTVFAVAHSGPTGLASATAEPDYHGPGRGAGNSVNALLDGFVVSGEAHYLRYAELLIRRVVNPRDDINSLDLLNAELRWSYTVFLSALGRYLLLKSQHGENDSMCAYGAGCMLHYGKWMTRHEQSYLEHPEDLEYPTETWAAQDLRKANVLRLAARYMSGQDRTDALKRGEELADRAWSELMSFDTTETIRPLNLVISEGAKDCFLRTYGPGHAELSMDHEFDAPQEFVPQKRGFVRRIKSISSVCMLAARMLNVVRWPSLVRALRRQL